ncbi:MAG: DUF1444 domain-containing protein [Planctomycetota bacterium]
MSVSSAQIFVRSVQTERILKATEAYLARWAKAVQADWPDVPFLGGGAARRTSVLSPVDGWSCVLDPDPYHIDLALAEHLSASLAATTVASEIRGGELVCRYVVHEGGDIAREEREPPEAFSDAAASADTPMPLYQDPTREMLRVLRAEGIPDALWFLRQDALEDAGAGAKGALVVVEVVTEPDKKRPVSRRPRSELRPRHKPGTVPFKADVDGRSPEGRLLYAEIRTVFGAASHQAAEALLEIERTDTNRLQGPLLGSGPGGLPEVHFEYTVRGGSDEGLGRLLDLRREEFLQKRPLQSAFLEAAIEIARAEHDAWTDVRPSGFGMRVRLVPSGTEQTVDLDEPYSDYMEGRLAARDPDEALRSFLSRAASDLRESGDAGAEFASVSDLLMPCLVAREEAARLSADGVGARDVGHGVSVVVACQVGDGVALIDSDDFDRWGVTFDTALEAARENLLRQAHESGRPPMPVEIAGGAKALAFLSGGQSSKHLLLPGLSGVMGKLLGAEETICAVPDQDSLFVVGAGDAEAASALRDFARARLLAADRPLTAELFRLKGDSILEA